MPNVLSAAKTTKSSSFVNQTLFSGMADGAGRARGRARGRTRETAPAPEPIRRPGDVPAPNAPIRQPVAAPAAQAPVPGISQPVIIVFAVLLRPVG